MKISVANKKGCVYLHNEGVAPFALVRIPKSNRFAIISNGYLVETKSDGSIWYGETRTINGKAEYQFWPKHRTQNLTAPWFKNPTAAYNDAFQRLHGDRKKEGSNGRLIIGIFSEKVQAELKKRLSISPEDELLLSKRFEEEEKLKVLEKKRRVTPPKPSKKIKSVIPSFQVPEEPEDDSFIDFAVLTPPRVSKTGEREFNSITCRKRLDSQLVKNSSNIEEEDPWDLFMVNEALESKKETNLVQIANQNSERIENVDSIQMTEELEILNMDQSQNQLSESIWSSEEVYSENLDTFTDSLEETHPNEFSCCSSNDCELCLPL